MAPCVGELVKQIRVFEGLKEPNIRQEMAVKRLKRGENWRFSVTL
jgi:hypothetical protein